MSERTETVVRFPESRPHLALELLGHQTSDPAGLAEDEKLRLFRHDFRVALYGF